MHRATYGTPCGVTFTNFIKAGTTREKETSPVAVMKPNGIRFDLPGGVPIVRTRKSIAVYFLAALLLTPGSLLIAQTFYATYQIDSSLSSGGWRLGGWPSSCEYTIGGAIVLHVSDGSIVVEHDGVTTSHPCGGDYVWEVFEFPAKVDASLDTTNDGLPDTWLFSFDSGPCTHATDRMRFSGIVSLVDGGSPLDPLDGLGRLELSSGFSDCNPDGVRAGFRLIASESQPGPAVPVLSLRGLLVFTVALATAAWARLIRH
jgi:hypothetical protein